MTIRYSDAVLIAEQVAADHYPPIKLSAQAEFVRTVQTMNARGAWKQHPDGPINTEHKGETVAEFFARTVKDKPHYLMLENELDRATETWTSGNLTLQGARVREIGEENAKREAALWGVTLGSDKKGSLLSEARKKKPETDLSRNPWARQFLGDDTARTEAIVLAIKKGTQFADDLAAEAGTTVGRPLRR